MDERVIFGDKIKINYDLKDATGSINVSVWEDVLLSMLKISKEEIWQLYEACDPDTAVDPDDAAQQFADALSAVCNVDKMFVVKCSTWNDNQQFTLVKVDDVL